MKFLLYCDYGKSIGAGHLSRICSLGEELLNRNFEFKIIAPIEAQSSKLIEKTISNKFITVNESEKISTDFLIIDSYEPNVSELMQRYEIKAKHKFQIIDNVSIPFEADGYIPASPISNSSLKNYDKNKVFYYDREFVLLLRNRILEHDGKYKKVPDKILITLGYYSDQKILRKLTESIQLISSSISILIPGHFDDLSWPENVFFYSPEQYLEEVCNCTLVISAAGISILELIFLKVPCVHIVVSDNQDYQSDYLVSNKLSIKLNIGSSINEIALQLNNQFSESKQFHGISLENKPRRNELVESLLTM